VPANEEHNIAVVRRFIDGAVNGHDPAVINENMVRRPDLARR